MRSRSPSRRDQLAGPFQWHARVAHILQSQRLVSSPPGSRYSTSNYYTDGCVSIILSSYHSIASPSSTRAAFACLVCTSLAKGGCPFARLTAPYITAAPRRPKVILRSKHHDAPKCWQYQIYPPTHPPGTLLRGSPSCCFGSSIMP